MAALLFILGLAMLLVGGRVLVNGAVDIATRLGVPPLVVGLTLVAWGTSAPELAFNLTAAWNGKTDLVFGNVAGASISNLGMVMGISAIIAPLLVSSTIVRREIPLMLGLYVVFGVAAVTTALDTALGGRLRPLILLALFGLYTAWLFRAAYRERRDNRELAQQTTANEMVATTSPLWISIVSLVGGLLLLSVGGNVAADAASEVAKALGMSDRIVGLTVVSIGTTLPELVTSIMAVRKRQVDLAVGNAVGSCIFNVAVVFGLSGMISPAPIPEGGEATLIVLCLLGVLLVPMSRTFKGHIARVEGALLLLGYIGYIAFELWRTRG